MLSILDSSLLVRLILYSSSRVFATRPTVFFAFARLPLLLVSFVSFLVSTNSENSVLKIKSRTETSAFAKAKTFDIDMSNDSFTSTLIPPSRSTVDASSVFTRAQFRFTEARQRHHSNEHLERNVRTARPIATRHLLIIHKRESAKICRSDSSPASTVHPFAFETHCFLSRSAHFRSCSFGTQVNFANSWLMG